MLTCFYVCPSDRSTSAPQAEARLAAKRAARAEAREIRMKELERQQKEEDSERYSRLSRRHASVSDDEERMSVGSRGSYRPSDYGGLLGSSSRASSRASSARASPVVEERADREFMEKGSRTASTLSAATLASLGGASSRRGSCDTSFSVETEASIREMKDSLLEAEEKYRRAMISNAQLHNDKTTLMFQVENLREELSDMEELLWEARRRWEESSKELERERQANSVLKGQFKEMEDRLRQTNETLTEVSDLRLKSSSYCQEVSDLQEALQWKEKKIAALERHRETSDIVRIERDRLRDEVVRLRDSLKNHGVVFSPDTSNGDVELADDDSASPLAEDPPHSGRESVLGKASEQQPAEDSKPQRDRKDAKRQQSLDMNSTSDQSRVSRERRNPVDKPPGRNRPQRNKGVEKDPTKRLPSRLDPNQADNKQPDMDGSVDQAFKDQSTAHSVGDFRKKGESSRKAFAIQKVSGEKDFRSRLVPPRPAKEMIMDNRAMVSGLSASGKRKSSSDETINLDVSLALENEASSSETSTEPKGGTSQSLDEDVTGEGGVPGLGEEGGRSEAAGENRQSNPESVGVEEESVVKSESKAPVEYSPTSQRTGEPLHRAAAMHKAFPQSLKRTTAFVPEEMWSSLEMAVQDLLQGLEDKPGFVFEISRILSEILICLHQWISDLENTLRTSSGETADRTVADGDKSTCPKMDAGLSAKSGPNPRSPAKHPPVGPGCVERHQAGPAAGSEDQSASSGGVPSPWKDDITADEAAETSFRQTKLQMNAEYCFNLSGSPVKNTSADFVFVDSYFAEPRKNSAESVSDVSLGRRSNSPAHVQLPTELRGNRAAWAQPNAGQSSSVRRFMEVTAEEIRALAVPELALLGLQEGRPLEQSGAASVEETAAADMDSCEEADEEEEEVQQPLSQQRPKMDDQSVPGGGSVEPERGHDGASLDSRRNENSDCKIS
ncbi:PREDICTED: leucine-rich repeat flightless-interacting protein 1-like isoform X2 [Cyprinodon variegatus]|uniref:leucine-rich repeat flightless-interacting protein 1-like isoform X2 n=1 Tax=Cyprinodon variegatus TaxID=28743 RepID=UPI000742756F|nr:PREDICTED: leucine-rich repeat flightless-interacting protein 1-like isoform X2 [Cyprinodon variegatus]